MNEEMQKQLLEWAKQAVVYGQTAIPIIVDQYVRYWTIMHILGIVLALGFLCLMFWWYRYTNGKIKGADAFDEVGWVTAKWTALIVLGIAAFMLAASNTCYLIKIRIAPAVYIIDSLAGK